MRRHTCFFPSGYLLWVIFMDWITASLVMFFSSVVLYTSIRKAQLLKISIEAYSLFMFGMPLIILSLITPLSGISLYLSWPNFIKITIASIFFSYLGNVFSQRSILEAPNPGYSLIISKSYVIFTTLVSVLIFNSELTLRKAIAIMLIVLFSTLIMLPKIMKKSKSKNMKWLVYSFGAFFCWGFLALMSKHLIDLGVNVFSILFYLHLIVTPLVFFDFKRNKGKLIFDKQKWMILFLIGISSFLFNLFMQIGYKYAPNPGYINAVNASSIILVTTAAIILFKDETSFKKILGIIGATIGLILLFI